MTVAAELPPRLVRVATSSSAGVRVLAVVSALSVITLLAALAGLGIDGRTITGAPAWLKPAKFAVSLAVYCATLAWMLTLVQGRPRLVRVVAWTSAVVLALELLLIVVQVVRGTTSHFNVAPGFDAAVFQAMGALVALVFLAAVGTGILLARQRGLPRVLGAGVRGGIAVAVLSMLVAVLMLVNRDYWAGGAHTVGGPDGGPGLPVVGWSTEHGDLRIAHFVGLHALQVLPLLAWLLQRYAAWLTDTVCLQLVWLATAAAAGLVVLLAWQAERGLPLLHPDAPVLTAAACGAALLAAATASVLVHGLRPATVALVVSYP